jgi:hypothetical protein
LYDWDASNEFHGTVSRRNNLVLGKDIPLLSTSLSIRYKAGESDRKILGLIRPSLGPNWILNWQV